MSDENHTSRQNWILTELLAIILVLLLIDVWFDLSQGVSLSHLVLEGIAGILGLAGIFSIWYRRIVPLEGALRSNEISRKELVLEIERWKSSIAPYAANIRQEIEKQFNNWQLTPAEKETAFLLLKGLSLREIAEVRNVSEKTVKQHNLSIYQKSGLAGRAELSAFFLEDLLAFPAQGTDSKNAL